MDLRAQLTVVRRHWLLIVLSVALAGAVAAVVGRDRTPEYSAQAQVLLLPGDPTESVTPGNPPADLDSYSQTQAQLVTNPTIVSLVAKKLNTTSDALAGHVSVLGTSILYITANDPDPNRAEAIANGFAQGYITYSKETTVSSLRRTAGILKAQAKTLQTQLNSLALAPQSRLAVRSQYQSIYSQYVTATINQALAKGDAKIVATASSAGKASVTPLIETILLGAIAGLLIGLAGAFLREQLDDRIRSRDDAEAAGGGLPVLAEAPTSRRAVRAVQAEGLEAAMLSDLGEAARALRTAIMFYTVRHEERRILVTSPAPGDGKTLTSTLLAAAYAQAGFRTVLISADLRAPGAEEILGRQAVTTTPGLTNALMATGTGESHRTRTKGNVTAYLQDTGLANLSFMAAGSAAPNPAELLASRRTEDLLDELANSYDMLILDSAPLIPVADTRTLVELVDGVVMVTSIGQSKRSIARAMEMLRPANVRWLGMVVNRSSTGSGTVSYMQPRREANV